MGETVLTPASGKHLGWMDTLRGLAVFLVIFEHAILLTPVPLPEWLVHASNVFAPFRIPALMFLSGMLLPKSLEKPGGVYLRGKCSRIVWPYLIWSVMIWGLANWGDDRPNLFGELFVNPTTTPMWFLAYLAVYYAVGLFLNGWRGLAAIVPSMLASAVIGDNNGGRFFYLLAFFLLGDCISRNADKVFPLILRREVRILAAMVAVGLATASAFGVHVKYIPLYSIPVFVSIAAIIPLVERLSRSKVGKAIGGYGQHTIIFYVLHWPVMVYAWNLLAKLGVSNGLVLAAGNLAAGLAAGYIALALVRRYPRLAILFRFDLQLRQVAAGKVRAHGESTSN
ncbi:acyltransferase [Arthrobacter sp. ISL-85]|uniref:acyltransferase family protein n=1 Tax=Arthrobacter sp. ISL-85 TaxID=2819115 RepID=UPI001BEBB1AD|nr:acyltransferase [Arthrobacter sp. ISL-85]MBT2566582.1 acyltransferase [Arthrobacter sp. ISL-85]